MVIDLGIFLLICVLLAALIVSSFACGAVYGREWKERRIIEEEKKELELKLERKITFINAD